MRENVARRSYVHVNRCGTLMDRESVGRKIAGYIRQDSLGLAVNLVTTVVIFTILDLYFADTQRPMADGVALY